MKYKQINLNVSKSVNKAAFKTDLPQFRITVEQVLRFVELCDSSLAVDVCFSWHARTEEFPIRQLWEYLRFGWRHLLFCNCAKLSLGSEISWSTRQHLSLCLCLCLFFSHFVISSTATNCLNLLQKSAKWS